MPNETLLFLHILAAFMLVATTVILSATAVGAPTSPGQIRLANLLWDIGGMGTLVFGIWLALDTEPYGLGDGWIIAALGMWIAATAAGVRARQLLDDAMEAGGAAPGVAVAWPEQLVILHWARVALVLALLADMIFTPGTVA